MDASNEFIPTVASAHYYTEHVVIWGTLILYILDLLYMHCICGVSACSICTFACLYLMQFYYYRCKTFPFRRPPPMDGCRLFCCLVWLGERVQMKSRKFTYIHLCIDTGF